MAKGSGNLLYAIYFKRVHLQVEQLIAEKRAQGIDIVPPRQKDSGEEPRLLPLFRVHKYTQTAWRIIKRYYEGTCEIRISENVGRMLNFYRELAPELNIKDGDVFRTLTPEEQLAAEKNLPIFF